MYCVCHEFIQIIMIQLPTNYWLTPSLLQTINPPRMMLANRRPDVFTYSSLLAAWHRCSSWELANDLLQKIGSEANIMSQSSMLTSFVKAMFFLGWCGSSKKHYQPMFFFHMVFFGWNIINRIPVNMSLSQYHRYNGISHSSTRGWGLDYIGMWTQFFGKVLHGQNSFQFLVIDPNFPFRDILVGAAFHFEFM